MDRLTVRCSTNGAPRLTASDCEIAERLAQYEDTGLTPEEIELLKRELEEYHKSDGFLFTHGMFPEVIE